RPRQRRQLDLQPRQAAPPRAGRRPARPARGGARPDAEAVMTPTTPTPDPRRWLILAVIAVAQLMVVLDVTIVNIALPSAQAVLAFSDESRQWVITAYALTFGSLLLLGGRISDLVG